MVRFFSYAGGQFNRTARIRYNDGGDVTITQTFHGLKVVDNIYYETYINGTVPEYPHIDSLTVDDYIEEFRKVGRGKCMTFLICCDSVSKNEIIILLCYLDTLAYCFNSICVMPHIKLNCTFEKSSFENSKRVVPRIKKIPCDLNENWGHDIRHSCFTSNHHILDFFTLFTVSYTIL